MSENNVTIFEALYWGRDVLAKQGDLKENPLLEAQSILSYVLQKPVAYIFSHFEDPIIHEQFEQYVRLIERRAARTPSAHLKKTRPFFGRDFIVTPHTLTPRPETELIVENALELIEEHTCVVDIGTGSGAISISIASELGCAVLASDFDPSALQLAKANAKKHEVEQLTQFFQGHLLDPLLPTIKKQKPSHLLLIANLPYLPHQSQISVEKELRYEPSHALFSGVDGLNHYHELLHTLEKEKDILPQKTQLLLEIDPSQKELLPILVKSIFPSATVAIIPDLAKQPRIAFIQL